MVEKTPTKDTPEVHLPTDNPLVQKQLSRNTGIGRLFKTDRPAFWPLIAGSETTGLAEWLYDCLLNILILIKINLWSRPD
ncbi:MAG TPA: hypothetical protein ENJ20_03260 [Bacteroidetes bacterium]|nr:hypothetical protein [Bacteroidota bacterium]